MSVSFFGASFRWNLRTPPSTLSHKKLRHIAFTPKFMERTSYTIHVPVGDHSEEVCLLPDMDDGSVTYQRLCDALYEYYDQTLHTTELSVEYVDFIDDKRIKRIDCLGPYTYFGGLYAHGTPMSSQYTLSLNLLTS